MLTPVPVLTKENLNRVSWKEKGHAEGKFGEEESMILGELQEELEVN